MIHLFEVFLHGSTHIGGWTAKEIHQAVLTTFDLSDAAYGLNQLRYDLSKTQGALDLNPSCQTPEIQESIDRTLGKPHINVA